MFDCCTFLHATGTLQKYTKYRKAQPALEFHTQKLNPGIINHLCFSPRNTRPIFPFYYLTSERKSLLRSGSIPQQMRKLNFHFETNCQRNTVPDTTSFLSTQVQVNDGPKVSEASFTQGTDSYLRIWISHFCPSPRDEQKFFLLNRMMSCSFCSLFQLCTYGSRSPLRLRTSILLFRPPPQERRSLLPLATNCNECVLTLDDELQFLGAAVNLRIPS